jgi:hypothetical protein
LSIISPRKANVFCIIGGLCGGTLAWESTDGGAHFTTLPLPSSVYTGPLPPTCTNQYNGSGLSPASGDTDTAVAPVRNNNGFYNIYVARASNMLTSRQNY